MRVRLALVLTVAALLLASCEGNGGADTDPVAITPRSTSLTSAAGTIFVAVSAECDWTVNLEFSGDAAAWAVLEPASGSGSRGDLRLRYEANETSRVRSVALVLKPARGREASVTVYQDGVKSDTPVVPAGGNGYGIGYGHDVAPSGLEWLELPAATPGDGRELLVHNMNGQRYMGEARDGTRNYTCYWDYEEHLSLWVAYPLNAQLHGKGGYDYVWGFDPLIADISLQPDITQRSYGGRDFSDKSNWNRGHQLPRADRQTSSSAVASTCYPTNMTPQDSQFNSGVWATLENKVRGYIDQTAYKEDTLFVVTGCLYEDSVTYTEKASGFNVKVPTHYFKALLLAGHNSTDAVKNGELYYKAVGYFLPHDYTIPKNNLSKYMMSIDELEQKTGLDFFPNLIGKLGKADADKVEAAAPSSFWK